MTEPSPASKHAACGSAGTAVIIPHFNQLEYTRACCESLIRQQGEVCRILVIDNASTAHSAAALVEACPGADVLRMEENLGFAGGVNAGIREALRDPAIPCLWVLNNDTLCPPDTLKHLRESLGRSPRTGLAGCRMVEGKGTPEERIVAAGKRLLRPWLIPVTPKPGTDPDYLSGACLLIRRELLEDIGLFDEGYFFFFEDADFSLRAKQAGWNLAISQQALIEHKGSATVRSLKEMQARCYRAGHVRLLRKFTAHPTLLSLPPFFFRLIADALRMNVPAIRGNLRGIISSLREPQPTHLVPPLWTAPPIPANVKPGIRVLFASHQQGPDLPGYLQFALQCLSNAGYNTTLITTQGDLNEASRAFLKNQGVDLFPTENRGFDFGMWRRYLESTPTPTRETWTRVLLINDSVVYFKNRFDEFIRLAEACPADAVSLSANTDYGFHLQSYFLYLKPTAIPVLESHLKETDRVATYWDAVMNLEIGFSRKLTQAGLRIAPLFKTSRPFDFCYETLIRGDAGFVKRKLLEKRYSFGQTLNFLRNDRRALDLDYKEVIRKQGRPSPGFDVYRMCPGSRVSPGTSSKKLFWCLLYRGWQFLAGAAIFGLAVALSLSTVNKIGPIGVVALTLLTFLIGHIALTTIRKYISLKAVRPAEQTQGL